MRFELDRNGVENFVQSAAIEGFLAEAANAVKTRVESEASGFSRTRHFAGTIEATPVEKVIGGIRVTVFSTDFAAHIIEFGSVNNQAYAPFRRATSGLGLALQGEGERR